MADILHKIGIQSSPADAYRALTTREGLGAWWTEDTQGEAGKAGATIRFRFGSRGGFEMKVLELQPEKRVLWQVVSGPEEWMATRISWDLKQDDDYTVVLFKHQGWKEPVDFMHHCSTKWGVFLMSLKSVVETGKGNPYPNDVKIEKWEMETA